MSKNQRFGTFGYITTMLFVVMWLGCAPAWAQSIMCPTRPVGDSTNACASTAFVQTAIPPSIIHGTPVAGQLANWFDATHIQGITTGTGIVTWIGTPSSANLAAALTDETGTGSAVFANSPTFVDDVTLGTQQTTQGSIILSNTAAGAFATTLKSSNSATAAWTLTLPTTAGSSGQVLQTNGAGVTSWVAQTGGGGGGANSQLRVTLTSNTPVLTGTVSGATTVYCTPYVGNSVMIWNGSSYVAKTFYNYGQATTDAVTSPAAVGASSNYDLFAWESSATITMTIASPAVVSHTGHGFVAGDAVVFTTSGALPTGITAGTVYYVISAGLTANAYEVAATPGGAAINTSGSQSGTHTETADRCTRGPAWSSATARGTGAGTTELQYTNGILNNKIAITNGPAAGYGTYIGTIRSNASSTIDFIYGGAGAGGSAAVFNVWNYYNRVIIASNISDTTASWTYNSATARISDNSAGNRFNFISGMAEDGIEAGIAQTVGTPATAGNYCVVGVGLDQTTTLDNFGFVNTNAAVALTMSATASALYSPQLGSHFISGIEATGGAWTCTYYGGSGTQNGANPHIIRFMFKM